MRPDKGTSDLKGQSELIGTGMQCSHEAPSRMQHSDFTRLTRKGGCVVGSFCNPLGSLKKHCFLLAPYGYIIIK